ncbi:MAG: hypothetical protein F9K40_04695 [Kofleriaceae bacterium]|nr:MAG: hypothetical protein F9K40_04695 [Kofleriaceae bacterium]MBZ0237449.1 hypothetical protein [Kofleriaceae bacterium]
MRAAVAAFLLVVACSGSKTKEAGTGTGTGTGTGSAVVLTSGGEDAGLLPTIDRTEDVQALFATWNAPDGVRKIHEAAHPRFQESVKQAELQIFRDDFMTVMGPLVGVTSATSARRQAPDLVESMVFGVVQFTKGPVPFEIVFAEDAAGGPLRLLNLKMEVPKQFKPEPDRTKARAVAKAAADAILAGNYDALDAMSLPRLRAGRTPDDTVKLRALLAELGGGLRLELVKDEACGEVQHCMTYHAVGARTGSTTGATIELKVAAPMGTWRVNDWGFTMDDAKNPKKGAGR